MNLLDLLASIPMRALSAIGYGFKIYLVAVAVLAIAFVIRARDPRPALWVLHASIDYWLWWLGWPICVALAALKQYHFLSSSGWPERMLLQWKPGFAVIWGNDEDGVDGLRGMATYSDHSVQQQWWLDKTRGWSDFRRIVTWSAWRNSMGNLRYTPIFGFTIQPHKVNAIGNSENPHVDGNKNPNGFYWFYAWHGAYSGAWVTWKSFRLRIGWKLYPQDARGVAQNDYRSRGCGYALQFQRNNPL